MPGPGYDTAPDFLPQLEVMQFGLIVAAVVMSIVSVLVTSAAVFKVVHRNNDVSVARQILCSNLTRHTAPKSQ